MRSIFAASIILALSAIHAESTPAYFQCLREQAQQLDDGIIDLDKYSQFTTSEASGVAYRIVGACAPIRNNAHAARQREAWEKSPLSPLGFRLPPPPIVELPITDSDIKEAITQMQVVRSDIRRSAYLDATKELQETIDREADRLKATPTLWEVFWAATGDKGVGLGAGTDALFNVVQAAYIDQSLGNLAHKHGLSFVSQDRASTLGKLVDVHPDKGVRALLQPFKNVWRRSDAIQRTVHQELPFPHNAVVRAGQIVGHPLTIPIFFGLVLLGIILQRWFLPMISAFIRMQHNLRTPARLKEPE